MTMLSRAVAAHAAALERAAAIDVLILRGARTSLAIKAVPATSQHTVFGGGDDERRPIGIKIKSFDWIFIVTKLTTACAAFPGFCGLEFGDVVQRQSDGKKFVVRPVETGRPITEPHDAHGVMIVAHSQET